MLHTILVFFFVFLSVIILTPLGIIASIISLFGLWKYRKYWISFLGRLFALPMIKISACQLTVTGKENIPKKGSLCFVCNHGSIFDIALLLAHAGRPFGFIAKKELSFIPVFNFWIPMLGGFYIDRKNTRSGIKTINKGIERIKAGNAMVVFPEGRRSRGEGILPFHPGSLKLATQSNAPIIPVAISGTYEVFEKTGRVNPGPVKLIFCEPVYTADIPLGERKHQLAEKLHKIISDALSQ